MGRGHNGPGNRRHDSTDSERHAVARPRVRVIALRALAFGGVAAGALSSAQAVTLGEIGVESALGEPLSARVPLTLAAGEFLGEGCVSAASGSDSELTRVPQALVRGPAVTGAGTFTLTLATQQPLYEPMYELKLQVRCPGTALLVRHYVLMLDLPGHAASATAAGIADAPLARTAPAAAPIVSSIAPAIAPAAAGPAPLTARPPAAKRVHRVEIGPAIEPGSRYRVVQGDTLSTIAARMKDRADGLWTVADRIFAANPGAFIGGNQDLLKLGSEISIPGSAQPSASGATPAPAAPRTETVATAASGITSPIVQNAAVTPPAKSASFANDPAAAKGADPSAERDEAITEFAPPAASAVFEDERVAAPPAAPPTAAMPSAKPADADRDVAATAITQPRRERTGAPAWLAALAGVLVGTLASAILFRMRLLDSARGLVRSRTPAQPETPTPERRERPATRRMLPAESTMLVEEGPVPESLQPHASSAVAQTHTAAPPADVPASEGAFANLLGDDSTEPFEIDGDIGALDLDLTKAVEEVELDDEIGWTGGQTELSPTLEVGILDTGSSGTAEQVDLQTLAQRGFDDAEISQTLKDALNLLESDYERELTASQVIDRERLQKVLDEDEEDTLARTGSDNFRR